MSDRSRILDRVCNPNDVGGLLVVFLLAFVFGSYLLPRDFVAGTSTYWLAQTEDITQYIAGFNAFFQEPWHWPLWKIQSINWPGGTLATFVDILPLYSALLKLVAPASWFPFNPFGAWIALCIGLQAIGSWWIAREAQLRSWIGLLTLTGIFMIFPCWINRFGHISLFSQWILLFAFALVLQEQRTKQFSLLSWFALLICALFLNIYLLVMAGCIFATRWIANFVLGKKRKQLLSSSCALLLLTILAMRMTMWPMPAATGDVEFGFGIYSLNLLSPFSGGWFWQLTPDAFSPEQHFEGLNYLGLGVLTLLCASIVAKILQRQGKLTIVNQPHHSVLPSSLWCLLLALMVYAYSNQIYWGSTLVYQWSIPQWALPITGQFRASGRFFWPMAYALSIYGVVITYRAYRRNVARWIFCIALLLQTLDLTPFVSQIRQSLTQVSRPIINMALWREIIPAATQTLYVYPKLKCNHHSSFLEVQLPILLFASMNRLNINTGYIARHNPTCQEEASEIEHSNYQTSAYLFNNAEYSPSTIKAFFKPGLNAHCQLLAPVTLCTIDK